MGIIKNFFDMLMGRKNKAEEHAKDAEKHATDLEEQKKKEAKSSTTDVINVTELKKDTQKEKK